MAVIWQKIIIHKPRLQVYILNSSPSHDVDGSVGCKELNTERCLPLSPSFHVNTNRTAGQRHMSRLPDKQIIDFKNKYNIYNFSKCLEKSD